MHTFKNFFFLGRYGIPNLSQFLPQFCPQKCPFLTVYHYFPYKIKSQVHRVRGTLHGKMWELGQIVDEK